MCQRLLADAKCYEFQSRIDLDTAAETRALGCYWCGGVVHSANYPRKPRGFPGVPLGDDYTTRLSFCCSDCRRRTTPPSVRFLGRKIYLGAMVVLASAMQHGPTPWRVARLRELLGVSERTLRRWRKWWLEIFAESSFWERSRGLLAGRVLDSALPRSLLASFLGPPRDRLLSLLRFLGPLTTTSAQGAMAL